MEIPNVPFGSKLPFYGTASVFVSGYHSDFFKLGKKVYRAVFNDSDGYRSYCDAIEEVTDKDTLAALTFSRRKLAEVEVVDDGAAYRDFVNLVDDTAHVWLAVGTDNYDDYYPSYHFDYTPKD